MTSFIAGLIEISITPVGSKNEGLLDENQASPF